MIPGHKLTSVVARHEALRVALTARQGAGEELAALGRDYAALGPLAQAAQKLLQARAEAAELDAMAADPDPDMAALAREEQARLAARMQDMESQVRRLLLAGEDTGQRNVILEVRAGTGGGEAALFAGDLLRMYQRHAAQRGWKMEILSISPGEVGGCKEAIASVSGADVFARLRFEAGTHRVQRVPETESAGRIHTSAATVAVLPEPEEVEVVIDDKDLRVDVHRASGPGGQSVNTTDSAVRLTHLPTGLVVIQQDEKSQHKNKAKAMKVLRARLYEHERARRASARAADRRTQVGSGDRSERIRTYNFPQGRVTDHRVNLTLRKLSAVLAGEALDEVIDALITGDEMARLAAMETGDAALGGAQAP